MAINYAIVHLETETVITLNIGQGPDAVQRILAIFEKEKDANSVFYKNNLGDTCEVRPLELSAKGPS